MANPETPSFVSNQVTEARRFYLDLNPHPDAPLAVVCGGWEQCAPDYRVSREDFPYCCLEFVADGYGEVTTGGNKHELRRGIAFTYGPGCPHLIATERKRPLSKYFLDFSGHGALALLESCGITPGAILEAGDPTKIEAALARLIDAGSTPSTNQARIAVLQLESLLLELTDHRIAAPGQTQSYQTYLRCRDYIDAHYFTLNTAEEVATACHVDPAYLARLFARHARESPYRYLLHRKMTHAAELLDSGKRIVREVASDLGMDPFHFSRVFKRTLGVSPSDFASRREVKVR